MSVGVVVLGCACWLTEIFIHITEHWLSRCLGTNVRWNVKNVREIADSPNVLDLLGNEALVGFIKAE